MKKRILAILLVLSMVLAFAACGKTTNEEESTTEEAIETVSKNLTEGVLAPLSSGTYTINRLISKDEIDDLSAVTPDTYTGNAVIQKIVSGGNTAYVISFEDGSFSSVLLSKDGLYTLIGDAKFCSLTPEQYGMIESAFEKYFSIDFNSLSYIGTRQDEYNSQQYECESFLAPDGTTTNLWFSDGNLAYIEENADSGVIGIQQISISPQVDSTVFDIPAGCAESSINEMANVGDTIVGYLGGDMNVVEETTVYEEIPTVAQRSNNNNSSRNTSRKKKVTTTNAANKTESTSRRTLTEITSRTPLSTCRHENQSPQATCTTAGKCLDCGATIKALGHNMAPATCTEPSKCRNCGKTEGLPLGHKFNDKDVCERCGAKGPNYVEPTKESTSKAPDPTSPTSPMSPTSPTSPTTPTSPTQPSTEPTSKLPSPDDPTSPKPTEAPVNVPTKPVDNETPHAG